MRDVGYSGIDPHVLVHGTSVRLRHALPRSLTVRSERSAGSLCGKPFGVSLQPFLRYLAAFLHSSSSPSPTASRSHSSREYLRCSSLSTVSPSFFLAPAQCCAADSNACAALLPALRWVSRSGTGCLWSTGRQAWDSQGSAQGQRQSWQGARRTGWRIGGLWW